MRTLAALVSIVFAALPASAHFVFIVPDASGNSAKVVFSESLEPDGAVPIEPLSKIAYALRGPDGKTLSLTSKPGEECVIVTVPGKGQRLVFGSLDYGVMARGDAKPFLLKYHGKALIGGVSKLETKAPIEIEPVVAAGSIRFRVRVAGKPAADIEVTMLPPDGEKGGKVKTDAAGLTPAYTKLGRYGLWAKWSEAKAGDLGGKKYDEIRHYGSLVVDVDQQAVAARPDLPEAVSSFGATVAGDAIYVYGGHRGTTHEYTTATASPHFHRLKPGAKEWEKLPGGPGLQGLALVTHGNRIIRIGGMSPRNAPGTKGDLHSVKEVAAFDPAKGQWEPLPDLPEPRSSHDAVVVGDVLFVAGGWNMKGAEGNDWYEDSLILDLKNPASGWQKVAQPFQRRALTTAVFGGKVFVVGGINSDGEVELEVDVFNPATKAWSKAAPLPKPERNGFSAAACESGGRLIANPGDGKLYEWVEGRTEWKPVGEISIPRIVHRMVADGDRLIVLGGAAKGGSSASVETARAN